MQPSRPTVSEWIQQATTKLSSAGITSAHLDVEIILAHTMRKSRTYLHAHSDEVLSDREQEITEARLNLRVDRVPIAYIIGHKEFYGRRFKVTTSTLIPRPESEDFIEVIKSTMPKNESIIKRTLRLVDVGTGSGCIGITAKLEFPELDVTLVDISPHALKVATSNAHTLNAEVRTIRSDLLKEFPLQPDIIVANLPYVDRSWKRSPETNHEPELALFADDSGRALIFKCIDQSTRILGPNGHLILEADPVQHDSIITYARKKKLSHLLTTHYILDFIKTS